MRRTLINNNQKNININRPSRLAYASDSLANDNNMKKDLIFPLVIGIIFGALVMIFWQFTTRLQAQNVRLAQIEQITSQNTTTVNDVVSFINSATQQAQGGAAATPGANVAQ
jgi:hypothetical protein